MRELLAEREELDRVFGPIPMSDDERAAIATSEAMLADRARELANLESARPSAPPERSAGQIARERIINPTWPKRP